MEPLLHISPQFVLLISGGFLVHLRQLTLQRLLDWGSESLTFHHLQNLLDVALTGLVLLAFVSWLLVEVPDVLARLLHQRVSLIRSTCDVLLVMS